MSLVNPKEQTLNGGLRSVYYSLNNLANWMARTGYCLELVVGGLS